MCHRTHISAACPPSPRSSLAATRHRSCPTDSTFLGWLPAAPGTGMAPLAERMRPRACKNTSHAARGKPPARIRPLVLQARIPKCTKSLVAVRDGCPGPERSVRPRIAKVSPPRFPVPRGLEAGLPPALRGRCRILGPPRTCSSRTRGSRERATPCAAGAYFPARRSAFVLRDGRPRGQSPRRTSALRPRGPSSKGRPDRMQDR